MQSKKINNHEIMYSLIRNPISYAIYAFVVVFAIISFGESPTLVMQHIFIPYTVDVSRGIGETAASVFRIVVLISQCIMFLFVYAVTKLQSRRNRIIVSVIGIFFVALYFLIVAFGYVMPRLH